MAAIRIRREDNRPVEQVQDNGEGRSFIRPAQKRLVAGRNEVAMHATTWRCLVHHHWHFSIAGHMSHLFERCLGSVPGV
jgi:hypothetical protein